uniref:Acetyltransferase n=1 Tax=Panagrellus redivivus TaxID=6233 RepID=A0A7E4ZQ40_PANRE
MNTSSSALMRSSGGLRRPFSDSLPDLSAELICLGRVFAAESPLVADSWRHAKKPFPEVFDLYNKLAAVEPPLTDQESKIRQKLHPGTIWEFVKAANTINDKARRKKAIKQVDDLLTSNASRLQAECLKPLHLLFEGRVIEYVDAIVVSGGVFSGNHIEYLMVVAEAAKEPRILYHLIGYPEFFNKPELLAKVSEKMAMIAGKNGDIDGLAALGRRIAELYESLPSVYHFNLFKKAIHRIAHFYKCSNVALPGDLVVIVKKVSY